MRGRLASIRTQSQGYCERKISKSETIYSGLPVLLLIKEIGLHINDMTLEANGPKKF